MLRAKDEEIARLDSVATSAEQESRAMKIKLVDALKK